MKAWSFTKTGGIAAATLWLLLASCSSPSSEKVDASFIHIPGENPESGGPLAVWASDSIDLGLLAAGETIEIPYVLTNEGDAPLVISQVKPSCGCTVAQGWDKGPLAPGDARTITLTFDAGDRVGPVSEQATVATNAIPSSALLKFTARVLGPDTDLRP